MENHIHLTQPSNLNKYVEEFNTKMKEEFSNSLTKIYNDDMKKYDDIINIIIQLPFVKRIIEENNSLREKLNRELFDIISRQGNPAELIVGSDYTFTQVLENPQSRKVAPPSARKLLEYKIARGGSFITHYKHIALWQRISLLKSYCTSFLGFRTTCDDA